MTLLSKNDQWPTTIRIDPTQVIRVEIEVPKPFKDVVVEGIYKFRTEGGEPTHLLVHPKFKTVLKSDIPTLLASIPFRTAPEPDEPEKYLGLTIINTSDAGLELLGNSRS